MSLGHVLLSSLAYLGGSLVAKLGPITPRSNGKTNPPLQALLHRKGWGVTASLCYPAFHSRPHCEVYRPPEIHSTG